MKPLTQQEVLRKMADNLDSGESFGFGMVIEGGPVQTSAKDFDAEDIILIARANNIYEAPRTRTINDIEVPAPDSGMPEAGVYYWHLKSCDKKGYSVDIWEGTDYDHRCFKNGLWTVEDHARQNAEALRNN